MSTVRQHTPAGSPTPAAPRDETKSHNWLWIDVETTGLTPSSGALLEVAYVLCEDGRGDDLSVVREGSIVIAHTEAQLEACDVDEYVLGMHTRNGLWDHVLGVAPVAAPVLRLGLAETDQHMAGLAKGLGAKPRSVVLAGASVHFDQAWCKYHLPEFSAFLSHRVLDVSTLTAVERVRGGEPFAGVTRENHRALDDIHATITDARTLFRRWGR